MKSAGAWFSRQIKATARSMLGIMFSVDGARGHLDKYSNMESNVPDLEVEHDVVVEHRAPQGASVLVSVQDFQPRVSAVYSKRALFYRK
jgi:hypothetical protein